MKSCNGHAGWPFSPHAGTATGAGDGALLAPTDAAGGAAESVVTGTGVTPSTGFAFGAPAERRADVGAVDRSGRTGAGCACGVLGAAGASVACGALGTTGTGATGTAATGVTGIGGSVLAAGAVCCCADREHALARNSKLAPM
jgi:hypothetical protein